MAPQILVIASFLSVTWGIYLIGTIKLYMDEKGGRAAAVKTHEQLLIVAFRRFIVALCAWLFVFSFVFRTGAVVLGVGDEVVGQVIFYALLGSNVVGSIFAIVSLWFD